MPLLDLEIMAVNLEAETDFLDLGSALITTGLAGLDLLGVLEFAVIDELGHRWFGVRRHLDQIEIRLPCQIERDRGCNDPHLFAVWSDQAYLGYSNLVVDPWFVANDDSFAYCSSWSLVWSPAYVIGFSAQPIARRNGHHDDATTHSSNISAQRTRRRNRPMP